MHCQRNIYQSRTLDLLRNCLSDGQNGGCKQRGQTATIWLKALLMSRLAVCSRDLHWHWINWTLLCDTMEVSMLRLAWLPIACSMCSSPYVGRTVPLLKPPQSPHCYLGEVDHAKNFPPPLATQQARSYRANWAIQTLLFSKPLDLVQVCHGNKICSKPALTWKLTLVLAFPAHCISN